MSKIRSKSRLIFNLFKEYHPDDAYDMFYEHFPKDVSEDIGNYIHLVFLANHMDSKRCQISLNDVIESLWTKLMIYKKELYHNTFRIHMIVADMIEMSMNDLIPYPDKNNRREVKTLTQRNLSVVSSSKWDSMSSVSRPRYSKKPTKTREFIISTGQSKNGYSSSDD